MVRCKSCGSRYEKLQNFGNSNLSKFETQSSPNSCVTDFTKEPKHSNVGKVIKFVLILLCVVLLISSGFLIHKMFNKTELLYSITSSAYVLEGQLELVRNTDKVMAKITSPYDIPFNGKKPDTVSEIEIQNTSKAIQGDTVQVTGHIYKEVLGEKYTMLVDKIVVKSKAK